MLCDSVWQIILHFAVKEKVHSTSRKKKNRRASNASLLGYTCLKTKHAWQRHPNDIRFEKYMDTKLKCDIFDTKW